MSSMTNRLFCIGYGYVAQAFAERLRAEGWRIAGTTTSPDKADRIRAAGVEAHLFDELDKSALDGTSAVLVSTPPDEAGCPALRAAGPALAARAQGIGWLGYLSSNGVYGDHDGAWVDEDSPLKATAPRARRRIEAEEAWDALADSAGLPLIAFRLPGIYGPGRSAFDRIRAGTAQRIAKQGQVFNRMHVDDIAAALKASMETPRRHRLYNLSDDEPSPPESVIEHACTLLGVAPPPLIPFEEADLSPMAKSFYADNKRVANARMKEALGLTLRYPTFREGLAAIASAEARKA